MKYVQMIIADKAVFIDEVQGVYIVCTIIRQVSILRIRFNIEHIHC